MRGMQKNHLEFSFWIEIHIELNILGSLKSVAHIKEQSEWVRSISRQFQAIHSIKSANFPCILPLINIGKNTNQSLEKKALAQKFWFMAHFDP